MREGLVCPPVEPSWFPEPRSVARPISHAPATAPAPARRAAPEGSPPWFPNRKVSGSDPPQTQKGQAANRLGKLAQPHFQRRVVFGPQTEREEGRQQAGRGDYAAFP